MQWFHPEAFDCPDVAVAAGSCPALEETADPEEADPASQESRQLEAVALADSSTVVGAVAST